MLLNVNKFLKNLAEAMAAHKRSAEKVIKKPSWSDGNPKKD
jgi:hypothetical protein